VFGGDAPFSGGVWRWSPRSSKTARASGGIRHLASREQGGPCIRSKSEIEGPEGTSIFPCLPPNFSSPPI
jgi:hypothetical protein